MGSNFNDDDPVPPPSEAPTSVGLGAGKIRQNVFNKADAPLEKTDYTMVVELMGYDDSKGQRGGVDIVAVLDVSGSMGGKKLEKLKTSMKFLLKKLDPIDRLSIVTFSSSALRLCPLHVMDENGQAKIERLINMLQAGGGTNISSGLLTALSVLAQRRHRDGRTTAMMLMSDGQDRPSTVDVSSVPVYTFGLGRDHDSQLLQDIASKSDKGTYSVADVDGSDSASLNIAFASCLAGLLSVVVQDLKLTITRKDSEIEILQVRAGSYNQARDNESVTISFGNLYNREKRSTTVFLSLPAVKNRIAMDILKIAFSYTTSVGGRVFRSPPISATVTRTGSPVTEDPVEVVNEKARGDTAAAIEDARKKADANNLSGARDTMEEAKKSLDSLGREADELIKALKYEVQHFLRLLKDSDTYKKEGRAFALSSELSHKLQRFAARGDAAQLVALGIPLVVTFVNQAVQFDRNPNLKVPSTNDDKKKADEKAAELERIAAKEKKEEDDKNQARIDEIAKEEKKEAAELERIAAEKKEADEKAAESERIAAEQKKKRDEEIQAAIDEIEKEKKKKAFNENNALVKQADTLKEHLDQAIKSLEAIQNLVAALQPTT